MGYNKIIYNGKILIDLTICTVTPETLAEGITAYNAAGNLITGAGVVVDVKESNIDTVASYNKIIYNGKTLIDLTACTVTPETLAEGVTAYDAAGRLVTGAAVVVAAHKVYTGFVVHDVTTERHSFTE